MNPKPIDQPEDKQPLPIQPKEIEQPEGSSFSLAKEAPSETTDQGMQTYLSSGKLGQDSSWKDETTGLTYKATSHPDPTQKGATQVTVTAYDSPKGKPLAEGQYKVVTDTENYRSFYTVYNEPGTIQNDSLSSSHMGGVPTSLGALLKTPAGQKFYHELIMGMAIKMMNDMKKQQHIFSKAQEND